MRTASTQLRRMINEPMGSLPAKAEIENLASKLAVVMADEKVDERAYLKTCIEEETEQTLVTARHTQILLAPSTL